MKIAIMQPAFIPYLGYFELFRQTDLFVVLDCVQFNRRWYSHRNKLKDANGNLQWLTLPLARAPQDTPIHRMKFADDAKPRMAEQMRRFPALARMPEIIDCELRKTAGSLTTYLVGLLESCCWELAIPCVWTYSSGLNLPDDLRGQDRILAICEMLGATEYLNAPGGRALYDERAFADRGVKLEFLPEWTGGFDSVLETIAERQEVSA